MIVRETGATSMDEEAKFVDHYTILGVHPETNSRDIEAAYRHLAMRYHPDHPGTADVDRFRQILAAYRALKSPEERARYNHEYAKATGFEFGASVDREEAFGEALSDAAAHAKILSVLYKRRRESTREPGLGHYMVQQELNCSDESFEFFVWYLKEKGFIAVTEQGQLAITIVGVDHVISTSKADAKQRLRITQLDSFGDEPTG